MARSIDRQPDAAEGEIQVRLVLVVVAVGVTALFWFASERTGEVLFRGFAALGLVLALLAVIYLARGLRARSAQALEADLDDLALNLGSAFSAADSVRAHLNGNQDRLKTATIKRADKALTAFDGLMPAWEALGDRPRRMSVTRLAGQCRSIQELLARADSRVVSELALVRGSDS